MNSTIPEAEFIEEYQKLAESDPVFRERLQSICDFLNQFQISVD